jgi:hypothetical protein
MTILRHDSEFFSLCLATDGVEAFLQMATTGPREGAAVVAAWRSIRSARFDLAHSGLGSPA